MKTITPTLTMIIKLLLLFSDDEDDDDVEEKAVPLYLILFISHTLTAQLRAL